KLFKPLRDLALERFYERALDEAMRIGSDQAKSKRERYLAIYWLMRERDKEIESIFDKLRRSTAVFQICAFRVHGLVTEEELRQFSPELFTSVQNFIRIRNQALEVEDEENLSPEHND